MDASDVTARRSRSSPVDTTGLLRPLRQAQGPRNDTTNDFNYWSYFVDPEIPVWKRMLAGATLPIAAPFAALRELAIVQCSSRSLRSVAETKPDEKSAAKREGFLRIIQSEAYAGRLVVFFASAQISPDVQEVLKKYPDAKLQRSVSRSSEEETKRRQDLEAKTGKKFLDWNRVYYLSARDKATAQQLQLELMEAEGVRLIYPEQKKIGPSLASTPNLEGLQTYLQGPNNGGLNIVSAWDQGVYGAGVMAVVNDSGINWEHGEFELARRSVLSGGNGWVMGCDPSAADNPLYFCSSSNVAHGTATTGIIHARHGADEDRHGVRGIAPEAWTTIGTPAVGESALPNGSIYLTECAQQYSWDGQVTCQEGASGTACVPCISNPISYAKARERVVSDDIVLFYTAGNGAINLDTHQLIDDETMAEICGGPATDPAAADCWAGSGAILVGASQGDRDMVNGLPQKQSYSNCGNEVELYGWGERVVTTSWHPESGPLSNYEWITVEGGPNPPNDDVNAYFTNEFGGTSSAAVMVAGAATLVQSYFKDIANGTAAGDESIAPFRYLTPKKLNEILFDSGMDAYFADDCSIGRQPDVAAAFGLVETFWSAINNDYPELSTTEISEDRLNALKEAGVGLVCVMGREDKSDPACPESIMHPPLACNDYYPYLAKKMDIDGDGRGDLVSWTPGEWKIDLSSGEPVDPNCGQEGFPPCPEPNDNYGNWDITLNYPPVSNWEEPVIQDYNSDGRADLAIYDRENGKGNISFTDDATLQGVWNGWEQEVNWPGIGDSNAWGAEFYTRSLPADYNGDDWIDLAVQTSDGHWKINFDWRSAENGWSGCAFTEHGPLTPTYANADGIQDLAYLTSDELAAYPGWAYLPSVGMGVGGGAFLAWRGPDGVVKTSDSSGTIQFNLSDFGAEPLGGIENHPIVGDYGSGSEDLGVKTHDGFWRYYSSGGELLEPEPNGVFGNGDCKSFVANLDGDDDDDRAVMCAEEWRIVYSSQVFVNQNDADEVRRVSLGYTNPASLPGQPVFGGLSYDRVQQVRNFVHDLGVNNIPPLFDYPMTPYDYCALPWYIGDMPEECF